MMDSSLCTMLSLFCLGSQQSRFHAQVSDDNISCSLVLLDQHKFYEGKRFGLGHGH